MLWDIGDRIRLADVPSRMGAPASVRGRTLLDETIQVAEQPVTIDLGEDSQLGARVRLRCYHFGVVAMQWVWETPQDMTAGSYPEWSRQRALQLQATGTPVRTLSQVLARLGPVIEDVSVSTIVEDYVFHRVQSVGPTPNVLLPAAWPTEWVAGLLSGSQRRLSDLAQRALVPEPVSYYDDDHAWIAWDAALIVDPQGGESDVEFLVEFANAQLLELRVYDAVLTQERTALLTESSMTRSRGAWGNRRRHTAQERQQQGRVAEVASLVERAEHALKITEDAWLGRVYATAFAALRGPAWREQVDRQLAVVHQSWTTARDTAASQRGEQLEIAIVVLIVIEVVMALWRGH